jgi:hypothetical protein
MNALRKDVNSKEVGLLDFQKATEKVPASIVPELEAAYKGFMKQARRVQKPTTPVA